MAHQNINWKLESLYLDRTSEFRNYILFYNFISNINAIQIHFSIHIKSLKVNEIISHECSALFFTSGRFKTSIECSHLGSLTNEEHHSINALAQTYALNMDGEKIDSQVWQYIPAPEITVVEQT